MQILHIANSDKVVDYRGFDVVVSVLHRSYKRRNLKKIGISDFSLVTRYNTNKYLSHKLCHLDEGEIPPVKNIQLPQYISPPAEGKQQNHKITTSQKNKEHHHKKTKQHQFIRTSYL